MIKVLYQVTGQVTYYHHLPAQTIMHFVYHPPPPPPPHSPPPQPKFCINTGSKYIINNNELFFRLVHNSGPVISMLIILGCILNYVTVILYGFDYSLVSPDTVTRFCRVSIDQESFP